MFPTYLDKLSDFVTQLLVYLILNACWLSSDTLFSTYIDLQLKFFLVGLTEESLTSWLEVVVAELGHFPHFGVDLARGAYIALDKKLQLIPVHNT